MTRQSKLICASIAVVLGTAFYSPVMALTMKECGVKYKAAQDAGTLKGMKWSDFRKSECGPGAAPASAAAAPPAGIGTTGSAPVQTTPPAGAIRPTNAVFPAAVSPKYATETAGKARLKTCVDQYKVNKAANANGGLKWIERGGGYWSECNRRLKG